MKLIEIVLVAFGGLSGALVRFMSNQLFAGIVNFPLSTLIVNIVGSFLVGFVTSYATIKGVSPELRLLLIVGFAGALTTMSAFALEAVQLFEAGELTKLGIHLTANITLSILAVILGALVAK